MGFTDDIKKFAAKVKKAERQVITAATFQVSELVILTTPVKTGRAANNWNASIGAMDLSINSIPDPSAKIALAALQVHAEDAPGNLFFLTNNLPYIVPLEFGSSKRAPGGMLRVSVKEFKRALKEAVR